MRPKIVLTILLAALCVFAIAAWVSKISRIQPVVPPSAPLAGDAHPAPAAVPATHPLPPAPVAAPAVAAASAPAGTVAPTKAQSEELIGQRAAELNELAMQDSPAAHQQIVIELKNPNREIREAAIEALKQADDRSVVPQMREIADQTDDTAEKQAILDAIDFINLPSLTEYLHQNQKK